MDRNLILKNFGSLPLTEIERVAAGNAELIELARQLDADGAKLPSHVAKRVRRIHDMVGDQYLQVHELQVANDAYFRACHADIIGQAGTLTNLVSGHAKQSQRVSLSIGLNDYKAGTTRQTTTREPIERFRNTAHWPVVQELLKLQSDQTTLHANTLILGRKSAVFTSDDARRRGLDSLCGDAQFYQTARTRTAASPKSHTLLDRGGVKLDVDVAPFAGTSGYGGYNLGFRLSTNVPGAIIRYTTTRRNHKNSPHYTTTLHTADANGHVALPQNNGNISEQRNENNYRIEVLMPGGFQAVASVELDQQLFGTSDDNTKISVP